MRLLTKTPFQIPAPAMEKDAQTQIAGMLKMNIKIPRVSWKIPRIITDLALLFLMGRLSCKQQSHLFVCLSTTLYTQSNYPVTKKLSVSYIFQRSLQIHFNSSSSPPLSETNFNIVAQLLSRLANIHILFFHTTETKFDSVEFKEDGKYNHIHL